MKSAMSHVPGVDLVDEVEPEVGQGMVALVEREQVLFWEMRQLARDETAEQLCARLKQAEAWYHKRFAACTFHVGGIPAEMNTEARCRGHPHPTRHTLVGAQALLLLAHGGPRAQQHALNTRLTHA
jgi:hypothetical protein